MKPRDPPNSVHKIVKGWMWYCTYLPTASVPSAHHSVIGVSRRLTRLTCREIRRHEKHGGNLDSSCQWLRTWGGAQAVETSQARHAVTQAIRRDTVAIKFKVGCASACIRWHLVDKPIQPVTARNNPTTELLLLSCQHQRTCIRANK